MILVSGEEENIEEETDRKEGEEDDGGEEEGGLTVSMLIGELRGALTCVQDQKQQLSVLGRLVVQQTTLLKQLEQHNQSPCTLCSGQYLSITPLVNDIPGGESNLAVGSGSVIIETPLPCADFDDKIGIQCTSNPERVTPPRVGVARPHRLGGVLSNGAHEIIPQERASHSVVTLGYSSVTRAVLPSTAIHPTIVGRETDTHVPQELSQNTIRKSIECGISEDVLSGLDERVNQSRHFVASSYRSPVSTFPEGEAVWLGWDQRLGAHSLVHSHSSNLRVCPLCDKSFRSDFEQTQFEIHVEGHFPESNFVSEYEVV